MLTIRNPEAERLAEDLATRAGLPVDEVVLAALRDRWEREAGAFGDGAVPKQPEKTSDRLAKAYAILDRLDKLPVLDDRHADDILGYNEIGLFDGDR